MFLIIYNRWNNNERKFISNDSIEKKYREICLKYKVKIYASRWR